jgi:ATP-dependent exoDNAse (exonuclease V) alpha subunit
MAVYFMYMKTFGRGNGSSAISAIAYRAGERIRDERTGKTFDHAGRQDVMHKEIVLPAKLADADMSWALERTTLWNAVEAAESRKNARVAREFLVALPAELSAEQRVDLVRDFSRELVDRHGFAVDFAIHAPRTDQRNFHAHLLATTRAINTTGFGAKTDLELSDADRRSRGLEPFFTEVTLTRERWATLTNEALSAANVEARVDHRSLEAQGIDREPLPILPRAVYEMERRGEYSHLAERIREEYRTRVASRLEKNVAQPDIDRSTGAQPKSMQQVHTPPVAAPQNLDEIRRQAREAWLRLRQEQTATASTGQIPVRAIDDDLTR